MTVTAESSSTPARRSTTALAAIVLAVLATLVAGALAPDAYASTRTREVPGNAVAAHDHTATDVVAASKGIAAGEGRVATTSKPGTVVGFRVAPNTTGGARFVAGSDGVVTDLGPRVAPGRPVVIGENMAGRVVPDAQRMGADFYSPPRFDNPAQSMAHNRYWINEQMNQGRGIIDIGPAPGRAGFPEPTSPWYAMERAQIAERGYPWYVQGQQL